MGKIKGFLFAVRHREILMTDLGLKKNHNIMKNSNKETLKTVLQFIVSVITALLATLGVQSCVCN